ncbi:MAG: phosphatidate cytidylyltransferase [Endomicrobium sp.]|jgi:phosphatidate cytidylyltransferase|nr:phosphatidate cytidylyltransferase [Endomicrobium sp.]
MLVTRILTALVGIPLIFACIYFGGLPFYILTFAVVFLCVQEYLNICKKYKPYTLLSLILSSAFFIALQYFDMAANLIAISSVLMLLILFAVEVFGENPEQSVERISVSFLGAFFLPLALVHLAYLRDMKGGMQLLFFMFIVVWVLDTAAYAFGKMLGKHKLAKNVSPKKTLEGAAAGIVFALIAAAVCKYAFMSNILTLPQALILGFVISIVGQFSDLAESLIKRDGNIKDSGKIIPGHGGVFDRFDSYIFAAPAVYYILQFISKI